MRVHQVLSRAAIGTAAIATTLLFATAGEASAVTKLSQSAAASQLGAAGITHSSSGGCTTRSNSTCTSYEQINTSTVNQAITLRNLGVLSAINITGGTEVGHASGTYSHYNGYKIDISHSTCNNNYIKNSFTYIGLRSDGYPQWKPRGSSNLYCDEGNHWDITYF